MQHKVVKNNSHPPANCRVCGSTPRLLKHATFSYFFCDSCKDECDVWLKTEAHIKGVKSQYAPHQPNDVVIDKPGVYRIDYLDSPNEPVWYEHKSTYVDVRISGELVRATKRLTESDLPSRKPVSLSTANNGEGATQQSMGTVPDETASTIGSSIKIPTDGTYEFIGTSIGAFNPYTEMYKEAQQELLDPQDYTAGTILRFTNCGFVSIKPEETLRDVGGGHLGVQHGSVPPEDEL